MTAVATPGVAPGTKTPEVDTANFRYMAEGKLFLYEHATHSKIDVVKPGYFNAAFEKNTVYLGSLILVTLRKGKADPSEWSTGWLRIIQISGAKGVAPGERTQVAIVDWHDSATPVRHSGADETDISKRGKAA